MRMSILFMIWKMNTMDLKMDMEVKMNMVIMEMKIKVGMMDMEMKIMEMKIH